MLPLPNLNPNEPVFYINLPSTGEKTPFRRMKVSDEKVLILAKQSNDETEIYGAILQTIQSCAKAVDFKVEKLTLFDIEYIFLQLRGQSVSNMITLNYIDNQDNKPYQFTINIEDIKIKNLKNKEEFKILITDDSGLIMKYPSATLYQDREFLSSSDNAYQRLVIRCIDKIFDKDDVYEVSQYKDDELINWLDNLDIPSFNKIEQFVNTLPVLTHDINYKNSFGNERTITLATLNDFFMLR